MDSSTLNNCFPFFYRDCISVYNPTRNMTETFSKPTHDQIPFFEAGIRRTLRIRVVRRPSANSMKKPFAAM